MLLFLHRLFITIFDLIPVNEFNGYFSSYSSVARFIITYNKTSGTILLYIKMTKVLSYEQADVVITIRYVITSRNMCTCHVNWSLIYIAQHVPSYSPAVRTSRETGPCRRIITSPCHIPPVLSNSPFCNLTQRRWSKI